MKRRSFECDVAKNAGFADRPAPHSVSDPAVGVIRSIAAIMRDTANPRMVAAGNQALETHDPASGLTPAESCWRAMFDAGLGQ